MVRQMAACSDTGCQPGRQVLSFWAQQSRGNLMGRRKSWVLPSIVRSVRSGGGVDLLEGE